MKEYNELSSNQLSIKVIDQKENSLSREDIKKYNIRKISTELKKIESRENGGKDTTEKKKFFPKITNQALKINNNNDEKKNNVNNINNNKNKNKFNDINNNDRNKNNTKNTINNNINNTNNNFKSNIKNTINKNDNTNNININNNNTNTNNINNNITNTNNINIIKNNNTNNINDNINNNINTNNIDNNNSNINQKVINSKIIEQSNNNSLDKKDIIAEEFRVKFNNIIKNDSEYQNLFPLIQKGSYLTGLPSSAYNNKNKTSAKYNESKQILKNLKEKEKSLNKEISSIKNKKQKLLNISLGNLGLSNIDKNINSYEEKRLQSIENNLIEKLEEVKTQIKNIFQKEEDLKKNKSSLIQNFLKKYENEENAEKLNKLYNLKNNNNTERAIIKLQKKCNIKNINRFKKEKSEYKINQENIIENELEQKKIFLKEQKEKEKEIMKKRKMRIDEQMKKIKETVKSLENKPVENYLFYKMVNNFEEKEKLFYKKVKLTEKVVGREELKILNQKYIEKKNELEKKAIEKTLNMKELWHSRSLILPKYKSPILRIIEKDERIKMEKEEKKRNKQNKFYEDKKQYFKDLVPLPKINEASKKDIMKKNFSMLNLHGKKRVKYIHEELNKINNIRKNSFNIKNKRFKQSNNLNKRYKYRINIINKNNSQKMNKEKIITKTNNNNTNNNIINGLDIKEKVNNSMELNKNIKDMGIKILTPNKKVNIKNPKEINYLKEFENNNSYKIYNWDKYIDNDNENKPISIQNIKNQIEALDEKVERKQKLLKLKGGFSNNLNIGNDVNNLLINSIKGKLSIIKAINQEN